MAKKPKKGDTDYLYYGKPKKDSWVRDTAGTTKSLDKKLKAGGASESDIAGFKRYMNYKTARQEQENRGAARAVSSFEKSHAESLRKQKEQQDLKQKRENQFEISKQKKQERNGIFGFLDRTLGRASHAASEFAFGKEFVDRQDENYQRLADSKKDRKSTRL